MAKKRRLRVKAGAKTLRDTDLAARLFQELVGDLRLGEMRWTDVASFRDQALALPKWHGKGASDALCLRPVERLSKKTINKHLSSLKFVVKAWVRQAQRAEAHAVRQ
ncbi:hypothetical protein [Belnapia sp. F-4-1]|uniref:hypothetical protein n=1 Tax=Belnapia sp. F-4-1 TaxID=1545443 RepID=UPI001184A089|nr:hypothetical protein [Belnapia sp. F-4-1]